MTSAALPRSDGPQIWIWSDAALYVGPSLDPDLHAGSVLCLAVGVDGDLVLEHGDGREVRGRTLLVEPGVTHRVKAGGTRTAFVYLDPRSGRAQACRDLAGSARERVAVGHAEEGALLDLLAGVVDPDAVLERAAPRAVVVADDRVLAALDRLAVTPTTSADELSRSVGLSRSRLLELFARDAGMSLRRYRLWARMRHVAVAVRDGADLTRASVDAGFASPSHFSDSFRAMFGLTATGLLSRGARIEVVGQGAEPPATS